MASTPPGAVNRSALSRKWLWMECPRGLNVGSYTLKFPNGTFPTAALKVPSFQPGPSNPAVTMSADGYSAAAIPAVVGSNSTPVITAPAGA